MRPARLVNIGEALREAHALFAHQWGNAQNPAAVGLIVFRPEMSAIDGCHSFQDLREPGRQPRVTEFAFPARELVAILEIAELIFQLNQFRGEEQVFVCVIAGVVADSFVPGFLFRGGERDFCGWSSLCRWCRSPIGGCFARAGSGSLSGFVVQRVMKIDPEPAVQLENGERCLRENRLWLSWEAIRRKQTEC